MGPLANARRLAAVEAMVADAVERGSKVLCGGRRIGTRGYFYEPTVLAGVPDNADMMCNEPFGPVAPIRSFSKLDEAIELANRLPYGLAAYAYTKSTSTANTLMRKIEAGIMSINHCGGSVVEAPSGGVKESGFGREGGAEGLEGYLITKRVSFKY
jgi:succinate-semialdehyde dehydrogenase/glutarate-semialdehyde dehydrogenase